MLYAVMFSRPTLSVYERMHARPHRLNARLLCPPFMPALLGVAALHRPAYTVDLGRRATSCLFILPHTHPLFLHALFLFRFLFPISFSQRKLYCFGRHFILTPSQLGPWRLIQLRGVTPLFLLNLKKTAKRTLLLPGCQ